MTAEVKFQYALWKNGEVNLLAASIVYRRIGKIGLQRVAKVRDSEVRS